jgi:hypothetical protein
MTPTRRRITQNASRRSLVPQSWVFSAFSSTLFSSTVPPVAPAAPPTTAPTGPPTTARSGAAEAAARGALLGGLAAARNEQQGPCRCSQNADPRSHHRFSSDASPMVSCTMSSAQANWVRTGASQPGSGLLAPRHPFGSRGARSAFAPPTTTLRSELPHRGPTPRLYSAMIKEVSLVPEGSPAMSSAASKKLKVRPLHETLNSIVNLVRLSAVFATRSDYQPLNTTAQPFGRASRCQKADLRIRTCPIAKTSKKRLHSERPPRSFLVEFCPIECNCLIIESPSVDNVYGFGE